MLVYKSVDTVADYPFYLRILIITLINNISG